MAVLHVGFSYPKKFKIGAWLISKWMCRPYSHVYLRFPANKISSTVYQASHGMVHFSTEENFLKNNVSIKEITLNTEEISRLVILQHCMNLAGEGYGYIELVKIFLLDICDYIGLKVYSHNGRGYICSELVGEVLETILDIKWDKPTYLLKPKDIEDKLTNNLINK